MKTRPWYLSCPIMTDRRTDKHTEITELIVAFRNFTNVPKIRREIISDGRRSGFERLQVSKNNAITKEFALIGAVRLLYGPQPHFVETSCLVHHLPTRISNEQLVLGNSVVIVFLNKMRPIFIHQQLILLGLLRNISVFHGKYVDFQRSKCSSLVYLCIRWRETIPRQEREIGKCIYTCIFASYVAFVKKEKKSICPATVERRLARHFTKSHDLHGFCADIVSWTGSVASIN
jgi:hypothetical protein